MISVLKDGTVVQQTEVEVSGLPPNFTVPVGVYDVRVEGDGMVTVVKRGVHVTPDGSTKVIAPCGRGKAYARSSTRRAAWRARRWRPGWRNSKRRWHSCRRRSRRGSLTVAAGENVTRRRG